MTRYLIKAGRAVRNFYNDMNGANLTGAIDIIVVRQKDGTLISSPIHANFGKLGVLRSREKEVELCINGEIVNHLNIRLNEWGTVMIYDTSEAKADSLFVEKKQLCIAADRYTSSASDEECIMGDAYEFHSIQDIDLDARDLFVLKSDAGEVLFQLDDLFTNDTQDGVRNVHSPSLRSFQSTVSSVGRTRSISDGELYESTDEVLLSDNLWMWKHNSDENFEFHEIEDTISSVATIGEANPPENGIISKVKRLLLHPSSTPSSPTPISCSPPQYAPASAPLNSSTPVIPDNTHDVAPIPSKPVDISSDLGSSPENSQTVSPSFFAPTLHLFGPFPNCENPVAMSLCGGISSEKGVDNELFEKYFISFEKFSSSPDILSDPNLVVRINSKYYSWRVAASILMSRICFNEPFPIENIVKSNGEHKPSRIRSWFNWSKKSEQMSTCSEPKVTAPYLQKELDSSVDLTSSIDEPLIVVKNEFLLPSTATNVLTPEQLATLPLKEGPNEVSLSVVTRYQGTCRVDCTLYLWNYSDKIVVSDIDGTITKSDALGQILPILGKDWSQKGVTDLYSKVEANGYKFLYLSARPIGQSNPTRTLLQNIKQRNISLPDGPLLLAPLSLFSAFHQEVIAKKPDVFKIRCLEEVKSIFPPGSNPFFAGYGNRQTDVKSYEAIGIPKSLIFIVNSKGLLRHEQALSFQSSYTDLTSYVDFVYPFIKGPETAKNTFSDYIYWKPTPDCEYGMDWCLEFLKEISDK